MKTIQYPENEDELRDILLQEDVVLVLNMDNVDYNFTENTKFSVDRISLSQIYNLIESLFAENGMVVKFK